MWILLYKRTNSNSWIYKTVSLDTFVDFENFMEFRWIYENPRKIKHFFTGQKFKNYYDVSFKQIGDFLRWVMQKHKRVF